MKKFAFVSDFDGTLTSKDFYKIIIDKYLDGWGTEFYSRWKQTQKINVEFLNRIFGSMGLSESELKKEILKIPFDESAKNFITQVKQRNGDFFIVSAGTSYYIEILLKHLSLEDIQVFSMKGEYIDGGIKISPDPKSMFYSPVFGIDKKKVIDEFKKKYEYVFFAGDSEPDLEAAKAADTAFACGELVNLLKGENKDFVYFKTFKGISEYMSERIWSNLI